MRERERSGGTKSVYTHDAWNRLVNVRSRPSFAIDPWGLDSRLINPKDGEPPRIYPLPTGDYVYIPPGKTLAEVSCQQAKEQLARVRDKMKAIGGAMKNRGCLAGLNPVDLTTVEIGDALWDGGVSVVGGALGDAVEEEVAKRASQAIARGAGAGVGLAVTAASIAIDDGEMIDKCGTGVRGAALALGGAAAAAAAPAAPVILVVVAVGAASEGMSHALVYMVERDHSRRLTQRNSQHCEALWDTLRAYGERKTYWQNAAEYSCDIAAEEKNKCDAECE